jgi:hypothetical protein
MDAELLAEADRMVAALSPGKRESVREIVVDALHRGYLMDSSRHFLDTVTGAGLVATVLAAGIAERHDDSIRPAVNTATSDGSPTAPLVPSSANREAPAEELNT